MLQQWHPLLCFLSFFPYNLPQVIFSFFLLFSVRNFLSSLLSYFLSWLLFFFKKPTSFLPIPEITALLPKFFTYLIVCPFFNISFSSFQHIKPLIFSFLYYFSSSNFSYALQALPLHSSSS